VKLICQECWYEENPDQYWPDEMLYFECDVCHEYMLVAIDRPYTPEDDGVIGPSFDTFDEEASD